jgi:hypothetical protein
MRRHLAPLSFTILSALLPFLGGCSTAEIEGAPLGSFTNEASLGRSPDVVKPSLGHTFQNPR